MKIVLGLFGVKYADVAPQISVDRIAELFGGKLPPEMHIGDLPFGMHARIGPPRARYLHLLILKHTDDALEFALDRAGILLYLPAVKVGAVVLDQKLKVHSGNERIRRASGRAIRTAGRSPAYAGQAFCR